MGTLVWGTSGVISGLQNNQQGNAIAAALATLSQGATAPTPAATGLASTAGLLWHDTGANLLKLRNQADTAWITLGQIDETNGFLTPVYQASALPALLRGYLAGLTLSNDGAAPNTKIDVAAGVCTDDGNAAVLSLAAGVIDAATVGADGLDTGALAASTWYHCFAIAKADGTARRLASTSLTPSLPAGYIYKRRIGSVRTDAAAHVLGFAQMYDTFMWSSPPFDVNVSNPGVAAVTRTLSTPTGIVCEAIMNVVTAGDATTTGYVYLSPLTVVDQPSTVNAAPLSTAGTAANGSTNPQVGVQARVLTNTSSQIRSRNLDSAAGTTLRMVTLGWRDFLGR